MTTDDEKKIRERVEKVLTENLPYMEADGNAYTVRFLIFGIFDDADKSTLYNELILNNEAEDE